MKNFVFDKNKILKGIMVLSMFLILISLVFTSEVFSKYLAVEEQDYTIGAESFFFSSNKLDELGGEAEFTGNFDIELYNFSTTENTSYNITYDVTISDIESLGNTTVSYTDDKSGELTGNQNTTATISISPHADVTSFKVTISTNNGFGKTLWMTFNQPGDFAGGDGSSGSPYQISSWNHLDNARNDLTAHYELINNLYSTSSGYTALASSDANDGKGWEPIGYDPNNSGTNRFTGYFNGQGYTIADLYINRPDEDNIGLFGHIGISINNQSTTIENICLENVNVTGNRGVGALVGRVTGNQATLIQYACVTLGTIKGTGATGGLVGSNNSHRTDWGGVDNNPRLLYSFADVSVIGVPETGENARTFEKIGGLAGCSQRGTIHNSYSQSSITVNNNESNPVSRVGGLAGCNEFRGTITHSYSTGLISVNYGENIGGFLGFLNTRGTHTAIDNCYWNTATSGFGTSNGIGSATDTGLTGLTTAQMQGTAAETNMSALNFTTIWQSVTSDYPILRSP